MKLRELLNKLLGKPNIRILSYEEAKNVRTIRCYDSGGDFRRVSASWCDSSNGCGGTFVQTDRPDAFEAGKPVPAEVLAEMTGGEKLVVAEGHDYDYGWGIDGEGSIGVIHCTKVIAQGSGYMAFEGICLYEGEPYLEPLTFRWGIA